jgi:hypothetical protein
VPFVSKEASELSAASGIRRVGQLLTGSRAQALEERAASLGGAKSRNLATNRRILHNGVFNATPATARTGEINVQKSHNLFRASAGAADRAQRVAGTERAAVSNARRQAVGAAGIGAAGIGVGHMIGSGLGQDKQASSIDSMAKTVNDSPIGNIIHKAVGGAAAPVARRAISPGKILGGAGAVGLGLGVGEGALHHQKQAGIGDGVAALGKTMFQGVKGMGRFGATAAKSIGSAARLGGVEAAGQAAMTAGRSGLMRAGNYIAQNPGAGAALVAAPALAAGYAAGHPSQPRA